MCLGVHGQDDDVDVEIVESDYVDLGEMVAQFFSLGIDPYPRSSDDASLDLELSREFASDRGEGGAGR